MEKPTCLEILADLAELELSDVSAKRTLFFIKDYQRRLDELRDQQRLQGEEIGEGLVELAFDQVLGALYQRGYRQGQREESSRHSTKFFVGLS